jgi:hypothetical protein
MLRIASDSVTRPRMFAERTCSSCEIAGCELRSFGVQSATKLHSVAECRLFVDCNQAHTEVGEKSGVPNIGKMQMLGTR